jgi:hypothetical protein
MSRKDSLHRIKSLLWDYNDAKRGVIMSLIVATIYYALIGNTSIFGYFDEGLTFSYVQPYGRLWYFLNPYFWNSHLYSIISAVSYTAIILPQIWLVKKKKINAWVVVLNILSAIMFRMNQSSQDLTVIAFAPLATINPLFSILLVIQKLAVGFSWNLSDPFWIDWVAQTRGNPWQITYVYLIAWFVFPILVWLKQRHTKWSKRNVAIAILIIVVLVTFLVLRQHQTCIEIDNGWICH